jgi:chromosome partitioning protein
MAYIISIANEKGGVAKTTTAISLGASLAEAGQRVLLVDMDAQANLSLALGIEPGKSQTSSAQVFLQNLNADKVAITTNVDRVALIPSNSELGMVERLLPSRPNYEETLQRALEPVQYQYDFILIDCPPFMGAITLNALNASNLLLIPTQAEYFSIYALRNMMGLIRRVRAKSNPRLTYRLLLTMFNRRNRVHRTMSEQLHTTFNSGVLKTEIEMDTKLRESQIAGVPIIKHATNSRAALQYRALAQEIMEYVKETTAQPA